MDNGRRLWPSCILREHLAGQSWQQNAGLFISYWPFFSDGTQGGTYVVPSKGVANESVA